MKTIGYMGPWYGHRVAPPVLFQLLADFDIIQRSDGYRVVAGNIDVLGIDLARNTAIEWARESGFDFLFFQDADTYADGVAPILEMVQTLERTQAAICVAPYVLRREESPFSVVPAPAEEPVYFAESGGTGLMAIRMAEIERIAADHDGPWFRREYEDARHSRVKVTGDVWFCRLVREHGGQVVVDARIPTVHDRLTQQKFRPYAGGNGGAATDGVTETA